MEEEPGQARQGATGEALRVVGAMPRGDRSRRAAALSALAALLAAGLLVACDDDPPEPSAPTPEPSAPGGDPCLESALAATKALKMGLKTRLLAAMQEGGPAAVRVCAEEAEAIRRRVARETGVRVGRASTKLRNPANAEAPDWVKAYLDAPTRDGDGFAPWTERTADEARVVSPLTAEGPCLTCHGEAIPPAIASVIDEHYPRDMARGFSEGELRGVVWAAASCE